VGAEDANGVTVASGVPLAVRPGSEEALARAFADYGRWLTDPARGKLSEALPPLLADEPGGGSHYGEAHAG
jgi:hypothetical protein